MNDRMVEMSELYTRIIQLEILKSLSASNDTVDAIDHHLAILRRRLHELKGEAMRRTIA